MNTKNRTPLQRHNAAKASTAALAWCVMVVGGWGASAVLDPVLRVPVVRDTVQQLAYDIARRACDGQRSVFTLIRGSA